MNRQGRIPRSRGGICGVLLILLGVWGGLGPFVSPYFHFGYTPDKTWYYSTGRLYFSIIPGAAAVLGGLLVLATRHRGVGIFGGLLGVLSGAWFVTGTNFVADVLHRSVPFGVQIVPASLSGQALVLRGYLELVALFTGVGLLLLFAGALAMGRFSMIGARDLAATDFPAGQPPSQADAASPAGQYPPATQYPAATSYPTAAGQFPDSPSAFPDTTTAEFPPEATS
jgi:hypothetical protein